FFPPQLKAWVCDSGQKLEVFIPFLGKSRPVLGRCCQTCTPRSWGGIFHHEDGLRDATKVTEEDTRLRGWLVRRVCALLAICSWTVPAD
ncbi:GPAT2 acyltransferase, partial [Trogon melanurus]|nr:GPAT2 acyltransferase [Trogon melanurus]